MSLKRTVTVETPAAKRTKFTPTPMPFGSFRRGAGLKLARFAQSKSRAFRSRKFSRKQTLTTETKLIPLVQKNEVNPGPIQTGAKAYYLAFIVGARPSAWDTSIMPLGGILTTQGVGGANRIGNFLYYQRTALRMQIDMDFNANSQPPVQFRMVVVKVRGQTQPAGITDPPQTTLFLSETGGHVGYQTTGFTGMDLMSAPLNRRDWVVFKDEKFTLSSPMRTDSNGGYAGYSGKYPNRKDVSLSLPYYKNTRISDISNLPEDLDTSYVVYLFASGIGKDFNANNWEVSTRGSTFFSDA